MFQPFDNCFIKTNAKHWQLFAKLDTQREMAAAVNIDEGSFWILGKLNHKTFLEYLKNNISIRGI